MEKSFGRRELSDGKKGQFLEEVVKWGAFGRSPLEIGEGVSNVRKKNEAFWLGKATRQLTQDFHIRPASLATLICCVRRLFRATRSKWALGPHISSPPVSIVTVHPVLSEDSQMGL